MNFKSEGGPTDCVLANSAQHLSGLFPGNSLQLPPLRNRHKKTAVTGLFSEGFGSAQQSLNLISPTPYVGTACLNCRFVAETNTEDIAESL